MARFRAGSAVALGLSVVLACRACGGASNQPGDSTAAPTGDGTEPVTRTFWHNATTGAGAAFWDDTAATFEADHPNVTIEIQAIQNEDLDGKLQTALNSGDAPDIFMQRGGVTGVECSLELAVEVLVLDRLDLD